MTNTLIACCFAAATASLLLLGLQKPAGNTPFTPVPTQVRYVSYYDYKTRGMAQYPVPKFAQVKQYRFVERGDTFTAELVLASGLPKRTQDRLTFELYLAKPDSVYELGLIAPLGGYTYPSTPPIPSGRAGLVDVDTGRKLSAAHLVVQRDRITISCSASTLAGRKPTLGLVRYAPHYLDDKRVSYGNECVAQEFYAAPDLTHRGIGLPGHPSKN